MTGKDRIRAALSVEGTAEFGAVIPYEDIYIRDNWGGLTDCPWWWMHDPSIERQLAWRADVAQSLGQDWIDITALPNRDSRESRRIDEREDGIYLVSQREGWEKKLEPPKVGGEGTGVAHSVHPEQPIDSFDEIDRRIPVGQDSGPGVRDELPTAILSGFARDLFPIARVNSPLWLCYGLWGFEDMMVAVATQPDLVKHAADRLLELVLRGIRRLAVVGAEAIWIEECLTDQISPDDFRKLNLPMVRRMIEEIRSLGMKSVYYFTGSPKGKWDMLIDSGADALSLEESKKGWTVEIEEAVDMVRGRCALLGNLDAIGILQNGSDDALREEVRRQLEAGRRNGGRFIMSLGSPVTPGTPVQRVRQYCELVHEIS